MQPVKNMFKVMSFLMLTTSALVFADANIQWGWGRPPGPPPGRGPGGPGRGNGIYVQVATYGANCRAAYGNATNSARYECNGRTDCAYQVSVNKLGDPAYGCAKDFQLQYVCPDGQVKVSNLPAEANGKTAYMQCYGGGGGGGGGWRQIRVTSATYGGNFPEIPRGNVTYDIARECDGRQQCNYFISVNKIGDPKYGWSKDYRVEYTCDGRTIQTAYVPPEANTQTVSLRCF